MDSRYEQRMERMQYMEMPRDNSWNRQRKERTQPNRNRREESI